MTELNHPAEGAAVPWPALDIRGLSAAAGEDRAVAAILESLQELPGLPVGDHPERFAATHDALAAALKDGSSGSPWPAIGTAPRPGGH